MAQDSKIEWTDHTNNLWWGCTKVHEGCDHCYAETLSKRWGHNVWGNDVPRKLMKNWFNDLNKFQKEAKETGQMRRVFVGSMMDIFEKPMPLINHKGELLAINTGNVRDEFFAWIDNGAWPNLQFLLLTKRPSNINKYIPGLWLAFPPENVMFGTSPVNQKTANKLIPQLLEVIGKRFLSVEPQLGPINFKEVPTNISKHWMGIDWVIQGGESGHGKRPFNLDWAYDMQKQCAAAGVPYFFKQIDKIKPVPADLMNRQFPGK